ncbi:MAG: hypothetical protein SWJ54_04420 [Cyanobacteriota bacterium]|nr:hypothetical protein [Cyanobacteriota bacterium]
MGNGVYKVLPELQQARSHQTTPLGGVIGAVKPGTSELKDFLAD